MQRTCLGMSFAGSRRKKTLLKMVQWFPINLKMKPKLLTTLYETLCNLVPVRWQRLVPWSHVTGGASKCRWEMQSLVQQPSLHAIEWGPRTFGGVCFSKISVRWAENWPQDLAKWSSLMTWIKASWVEPGETLIWSDWHLLEAFYCIWVSSMMTGEMWGLGGLF